MSASHNTNAIYDGGTELNTTFTIHESDSDSLFSAGSHHFGQDDDQDDRASQTLLPLTQHANHSSSSVFSFETIPMIPLSQTQARGPELQKKVSFWNGLGLVVGMMIGSGLFSSPGKLKVIKRNICIDTGTFFFRSCVRSIRGLWYCFNCLVIVRFISFIRRLVLCRIRYYVTDEWRGSSLFGPSIW